MNETYTINDAKEKLCFVSTDFKSDMYKTKYAVVILENNHVFVLIEKRLLGKANPIRREYVLPDYVSVLQGYVRDPADQMQVDDSSDAALSGKRAANPDEQV